MQKKQNRNSGNERETKRQFKRLLEEYKKLKGERRQIVKVEA